MTIELTLLLLIIVIAGAGVAGFFWFQMKTRERSAMQLQEMTHRIIEAQKQDQSAQFLQREINNLREQLGKSMADSAKLLGESQKNVGDRLDRAAQVVGHVHKSLGMLEEATKQVFSVGKDISQLQEILRAPKMRGAFGELFLGDLLGQILPPKHFSLQYTFKSGETVDAVVKLGRLVPVDAKFPLENFKRLIEGQEPQEKTQNRRKFVFDVKRHIDAIANKYILPDEGTFDFALMYVPAENVYYEMIVKDDNGTDEGSILAYSFAKRVVPVSPNSFYAYLHTISLGLKGLQIEENARVIIEQLSRLRRDFTRFKDDFLLVGKHLNNTRSKYEDAEKRLTRFEDKLITTGDKGSSTPELVEATTGTPDPMSLN